MGTVIFIFLTGFIGACFCGPIDNDVGIIGGHTVSIDRVPYMVSLRLNGTHHWCGGSIIHEQFILTAAHCIKEDRSYKVLVGTDRADNFGSGELYDVDKIIVHHKYSNKTLNFDVCLIKLKKPLTLGPNVAIIQLAERGFKLKDTMVNSTGWGSDGVNRYSPRLQQVTIPIIKRRKCQILYFKYHVKITSQMVCAGKNGMDSCQGDSGGPLTTDNVQVGITSFGHGCGLEPGIYSRVPALKHWIDENMKQNL